MLALFWVLALLFVTSGVAVAVLNHRLDRPAPRFALIGLLVVSGLGATAIRIHLNSANEPVWQQGAIVWAAPPVKVWIDPSYSDDESDAIGQAISSWNREIGCQVLKTVVVRDTADAWVHPADGSMCGKDSPDPVPNKAASTYYCPVLVVADVQTRNLDTPAGTFVVLMHELGHVLGLAHDPDGLMAPVPTGMPIPSSKDRKALRDRYCAGR